MKKKTSKKIKNAVVKTITFIMLFIFLLSASAIDSASNIPFIALIVSGLWIFWFAWSNGYME